MSSISWLPAWIVALFGSAAAAAPLVRVAPRLGPLLLALVPGAATVWFAGQIPQVAEPMVWSHRWVPGLGVEIALRLDPLALAFALLVCGVGALVVVFAGGYLRGKASAAPTIAGLLAFAAAMLGLVLADDALFMFVCWEATTLVSYLLVGLEHTKASARSAARRALLITAAGGLGLLGALVGLEVATGAETLSSTPAVSGTAGTWIAAGVLLAAFTKSAQAPFHIWLPGAMAAPTPVSAYLHSATMVKAGVYLVLRLGPTLGDVALWRPSLLLVGGVTAVLGGVLAMAATDLKRLLACTTVAALGCMMLVAGVDHPLAAGAALGLALTHGLYKAGLFMAAGAIEKHAGTRDLSEMPPSGRLPMALLGAAVLAGLSMAAAPPLLGFAAKETALTVVLAAGGVPAFFGAFTLTASGATFVYAALAIVREPRTTGVGRLSVMILGPPLALAVAGAVAGPASAALGVALLDPVVGDAVGLAVWHGVGAPLALSALALVLGAVLWRRRAALRAAAGLIDRAADPAGHDRLWVYVVRVARVVARAVQPVALRANLSVILLATVGLVIFALLRMQAPQSWATSAAPDAIDAVLAVFLVGGAFGAVCARRRLIAIGALGAVGLGAALFYLRHGAPDLAMTQLLVEVLTVVLLMLAFRKLPELGPRRTGISRRWSAAVALAAGGAVGLLVYVAGSVELGPGISSWFSAHALPDGHGRNVVNVILVDFRALDTLGEVAVLAAAALGAHALLARGGAAT